MDRSSFRPATIVVVLVALTAIVGCGETSPSTGSAPMTSAEGRCANAAADAGDRTKPAVAVLAPIGTDSPATIATLEKAVATVVQGSLTMGARFVLNGVSDAPGAPTLLVNADMVAEGPNKLMRDSNLDCKRDLIKSQTTKILAGESSEALDTISALSALKDLKTISDRRPTHVVLLGSALNRTELADGSAVDLRDPATLRDPAGTINKLAREGLNFRCVGWKVTMIAGSRDTNGKPVNAADNAALKRFWRLYFKHCGGALVAYSTQLAQFPVTDGAIEEADARVIPIDVKRTKTTIKAVLNSKVLFDISSAALRPEADGTLKQLIPLIGEAEGIVKIDGYTDNSGTAEINKPLSRARAAAVAAWITKQTNLPKNRMQIRGLGSTDPVASNATEAGRAKNRRVVLTIPRS